MPDDSFKVHLRLAREPGAFAPELESALPVPPRVPIGLPANLATLANWASRFVTAGPSVELPIFDAGRSRATVRLQDVRAKETALDYRRTVLSNLREVDDALAAFGADQAR